MLIERQITHIMPNASKAYVEKHHPYHIYFGVVSNLHIQHFIVSIAIAMLICALFGSCGSKKTSVKEHITTGVDSIAVSSQSLQTVSFGHRTSTASLVDSSSASLSETSYGVDTSLVATVTETVWYDTGRADNGVAPVAKKETKTELRRNGVGVMRTATGTAMTAMGIVDRTINSVSNTTIANSTSTVNVEKSSEAAVDVERSVSESQHPKYIAFIVWGGLLLAILCLINLAVFRLFGKKK